MAEKESQPEPEVRPGDAAHDAEIDQLLRAQSEADTALLRQQKTQFAVMFTDIVGSTAFFERYGDTAGLMMLQRHHELVLPAIEEFSGTVIKTIGDAVMATFPSAVQAVRAAAGIQLRLEAHNEEKRLEEHIHTRIGVNFGTGWVKDRDVFGDVVNTAARFVKACRPAQILASRAVIEQMAAAVAKALSAAPATGGAAEFLSRSLGSVALHGKAEAEEIFEIFWTSEDRYQRLRTELDTRAGGAGRQVLGRYELIEEIGRGAMGLVYKAYDPAVGRIVALKTVRVDVTGPDRDELIRRLRQEAQAAGRLEHPNIVTIYDAGEVEGLFYLTMQFIKGRTLAELLSERSLLPVEQVVLLLEQVCEGLHYAHERGIIHRDLKPSNIIITAEGSAKIVDFGIAKVAEGGTTKAGMILGTPSYMSPEQARGSRVDRRSDIFSLGAILYELLTGEKPFPGNTPTAIIYKILHEEPIPVRVVEPAVNPAFDRIVRKALAKSPFERCENCQELRDELKAVLAPDVAARKAARAREKEARPRSTRARKAAAPAAATIPVLAAPPKKSRAWLYASATVLVLLAGGGYTAWQMGYYPPPAEDVPPPQFKLPPPPPPTELMRITPAEETPTAEVAPAGKTPVAEKKATSSKLRPESRRQEVQAAEPAPQKAGPREAPAAESPPAKQPAKSLPTEQQQEAARWYRQAEQYVGQGKYREAIFALERVLAIDPNHAQAKDLLGKVRAMQEIPK